MSRLRFLFTALALATIAGGTRSSLLAGQAAPAIHAAHERHVSLEGAANFRDLGGYPTESGRHVKWGLVYRSNHLADLTAADYERLNTLGIKLVCDLRTDGERQRSPTVWQGGPAPEFLVASILKDTDVVLTPERLKELTSPGARALGDTYARMVTESPEQYGRVLRRLAYGPLPSVTHCTAGKDRTGVFSAVLLTILGVPRDVVIADYMLTGQYMATPEARRRAAVDWKKLTGATEPPSEEVIGRLYTMNAGALTGTFDAIDRAYGSFDNFVRDGLKLTATDLTTLRTRLLE